MLIPIGRCHDEEPSRKVLFDLMLCFDFLNNIWMSSCKATGIRVVSRSTTSIHMVDGNSWKKHDEKEVAIWRGFQICIKKTTFHERNDMMNWEGKWWMANVVQGRSLTEFHDIKERNWSSRWRGNFLLNSAQPRMGIKRGHNLAPKLSNKWKWVLHEMH